MKKLYIYLLSRTTELKHEQYDSCVVVAPDEDCAKLINPEQEIYTPSSKSWSVGWEINPSFVKCDLLGVADSSRYDEEVIISSFNGG